MINFSSGKWHELWTAICKNFYTKAQSDNRYPNASNYYSKTESDSRFMSKTVEGIELRPATGASHGGYIDFHYSGSTDDYTSRIIESSSGNLFTWAIWKFNRLLNTDGNNIVSYFTVNDTPHVQLGYSGAYMYLSCKNGRMDITDSSGTFGFRWSNGTYGSIWSSHADGKGALGNPSQRWNTVYATVGTINTSDRRKKKDISEDLEIYKKLLSTLTPIQFRYNDLEGDKIRFGFIAQDVEAAAQELGIDADDVTFLMKEEVEPSEAIPDGIIYQLVYGEFIPLNTAMIQDLQAVIQKQQRQIDDLERRLIAIEEERSTINEL